MKERNAEGRGALGGMVRTGSGPSIARDHSTGIVPLSIVNSVVHSSSDWGIGEPKEELVSRQCSVRNEEGGERDAGGQVLESTPRALSFQNPAQECSCFPFPATHRVFAQRMAE
jgi:hypothetical protein